MANKKSRTVNAGRIELESIRIGSIYTDRPNRRRTPKKEPASFNKRQKKRSPEGGVPYCHELPAGRSPPARFPESRNFHQVMGLGVLAENHIWADTFFPRRRPKIPAPPGSPGPPVSGKATIRSSDETPVLSKRPPLALAVSRAG
jgi:hypothetical protein